MNKLSIEMLIDPNLYPVGAAQQTKKEWVSCLNGPWVVVGTSNVETAKAFCRAFFASQDSPWPTWLD